MKIRTRAGAAIGLGVGVAVLAMLVRRAGPIAGDLTFTRRLQELSPALDGTMRVVSAAGSIPGLAVGGGAIAVALIARRRIRDAVLVAATGSAELVTLALRMATDRPRPSPLVVEVIESGPGTSFPSGHAADAAAVAVLVARLIPSRHRWRVLAWGLLTMFTAASGLSRVYLGAHWLSDVGGGYLTGAAIGLVLGGLRSERAE